MGEVLLALEGPIAPMICATGDSYPQHLAREPDTAPSTSCGFGFGTPSPARWESMTLADLVPQSARLAAVSLPAPGSDSRSTPANVSDQEPRHSRPARSPYRQPGPRDPQGDRVDRRQGRGARHHGPQRLGQDHPGVRAHGPSRLHRQVGRGALEGPKPASSSPPTSALGSVCFLAFQYPMASPDCRWRASCGRPSTPAAPASHPDPNVDPTDAFKGGIPMGEFRKLVREKMALLKMDESIGGAVCQRGLLGR